MNKEQRTKFIGGSVVGIAMVSLCSVALLKGCSTEQDTKEPASSSILKKSEKKTTRNRETKKNKGKETTKSENSTEESVSNLYDRAGISYSAESSSPNLTRQELQEISHVSQVLSNKKEEAKKQEEARTNLLNSTGMNWLNIPYKKDDTKPIINKVENDKQSNDKLESHKPIEEPIVKPDNPQPESTPVPPVEVVDYQALQQVLFSAENIDGSTYLSASYQALQTEISIGQQMLNAQNSSQSEVNAQTIRIQKAINSLVPKGNKVSLAEAIEKAQSISLELYTTASVENFNRVYAQALAVYNEPELTQQDIDSQVSELNYAMDQLVKRGDKTELQTLLEKTKQVDRQIYTVESLQALDEAIGESEAVLNDKDATQDNVNQAYNNLKSAFDSLKKIDEPDLSLVYLNRLIEECDSMNSEDYTSDSFISFEIVLNQSKELAKKEGVTQEEVQKQIEDLNQAKGNLVKKADKTALKSMIDTVLALQEAKYTPESWADLQEALKAANSVFSNENATQEQVNEVLKALEGAKNVLIEKEV
ncbi:FIVAR domain-containing protein [Enterococcus hirae]|uniref:FIVAR domain-containing protein n=1 Tax=Enterococcus hirae TaxID=1354 RepID=UPI0009C11380|nr:FIVAR domain-containing protein [Enterococcus hirae]EMF0131570.1 FIVAR domain-containing protein [Enterococcus hirae]EMF0137174.1 FIVAR domain-containing protein [Enterococcus hirae]EMF0511513.1 FIVAR domain-containing protein [Enterococcus hirae]EMF0517471.1 FIVAR domain-containing protein [Enterococcus hirae]OQO40108.1 hypothetical protein BH758_12950 [Enterococcus hirae]